MDMVNVMMEVVKGIEELYIYSNRPLEGLITEGMEIINIRMDEYE